MYVSATPYNGNFSCRGSWKAEENDDITKGDFIVIEIYDDEQWPYCGVGLYSLVNETK